MFRTLALLVAVTALASRPSPGMAQTAAAAPTELQQNIARLSNLDYQVRMHAARLIRRTAGAQAVPALAEAARHDADEFIRFRALVLLTAFNDPGTPELMRQLVRDPNDRVRQVVYEWFERRPERSMGPILVPLLQTEVAEFVRPALVAALAALGRDPVVERPMIAEIARGLDFFRSAVIEALGRHRAEYALDAIVNVARAQGALQDDAVLAIGRIGGPDAAGLLDELTELTPEAAVMRRAARCLVGERCPEEIQALASMAKATEGRRTEARAAVDALAAVAQARNAPAMSALLGMGGGEGDLRERVAVAIAGVGLRQPEWTVEWLESVDGASRDVVIGLLKDGFDSLEEDFAEEQFFAAIRAGYWRASEGSTGRELRAALIQRLDF
jgi:hypothetical protein